MKHRYKILAVYLILVGFKCYAFEFNRFPAGQIKGARQSWVTDTSIKFDVGYGEVMGSYWEITSINTLVTAGYTLSGLAPTANGVFHYLYIDRANSSFPNVVVFNSTIAPAWSSDFMGWYNAANRCIGAIWVDPNGKIRYFYSTEDETYNWQTTVALNPGSVSKVNFTWNLYDLSNYTPVNLSEVEMAVAMWESSVPWTNCTAGLMPEMGASKYAEGSSKTTV